MNNNNETSVLKQKAHNYTHIKYTNGGNSC